MYWNHQTRRHSRKTFYILIVLAVLASASALFRGRAASPAAGTLGPAGPAVNWTGDSLATGSTNGESNCIDSGLLKNCDSFALTLSGVPSDWNGKLAQVQIAWSLGTHDY